MSNEQTPAQKFFTSLLSGVVESAARAGAKALESITSDAEKALRAEADKIKNVRQGAKLWRNIRLGDEVEEEEKIR